MDEKTLERITGFIEEGNGRLCRLETKIDDMRIYEGERDKKINNILEKHEEQIRKNTDKLNYLLGGIAVVLVIVSAAVAWIVRAVQLRIG